MFERPRHSSALIDLNTKGDNELRQSVVQSEQVGETRERERDRVSWSEREQSQGFMER